MTTTTTLAAAEQAVQAATTTLAKARAAFDACRCPAHGRAEMEAACAEGLAEQALAAIQKQHAKGE